MRDIKFRAWTGIKMEYNVMAGFLGAFYVQGIDANDSASMSRFNTIYSEQTPIMRYTGLKDKNGKEIYEGDIIGSTGHTGKIENSVIEFSLGFYRRGIENRETYNDWGMSWHYDVIGNIYENPELLETD